MGEEDDALLEGGDYTGADTDETEDDTKEGGGDETDVSSTSSQSVEKEMKQEETGEEEETVGGEEDESDVDEEEAVEDEQGPSGSSKFDTVKEEIEEPDRSIPKVEDEPEITVCRDDYSRKEPAKIWSPGAPQVALRDVMENMLDEFAKDVVRVNFRYNQIRGFLIRYFGTDENGAVFNTFNSLSMFEIVKEGGSDHASLIHDESCSFFQPRTTQDQKESSIDKTLKRTRTRRYYGESRSHSSEKRGEVETTERKSRRDEAREIRTPQVLTYPFLTQTEEEKIFKQYGGTASSYAGRLAKILFAGTLDSYFKDQDPQKRDWLHEAVDYRFPTRDRYSHSMKWKNCSNAINKNMRDYNKDKKEKIVKEVKYTYAAKEQEADCFKRAGGDANKYAEYLSLIVFEGSWDKFFKEQDQSKKNWMRECVDRRFPISDKATRDHRWKICAAWCNRNRTKILGADGKVDPFPYFPQEIEGKCFAEAQDVPVAQQPAVYAELICRHLFADTPHLMFKEQELGKRHWLHHHVDRRFPTEGKVNHAAKWKAITQAINKNKSEVVATASAPATPAEKHVGKSEKRETGGRLRRSEAVTREATVDEEDTGEPENKRPRRALKESVKLQEAQADSPPSAKKPSKNGTRGAKVEPYSRYPFVSQSKEIDVFQGCNSNAQIYAKNLGCLLFENSLNNYYKDQDSERRQWMREIVDFRFPTPNPGEHKQKWKNVCAAINKNMPQKP